MLHHHQKTNGDFLISSSRCRVGRGELLQSAAKTQVSFTPGSCPHHFLKAFLVKRFAKNSSHRERLTNKSE